MNQMLRELKRDYPWHILFWGGYLLIKILVVEFFREDFVPLALAEVISLPLKIAAAYTLIYYLAPQFLLRRRYWEFSIYLVLYVMVFAFLRRLTDVYLVYPIVILYPDQTDFWNIGAMFRNLIYVYPVVGLGSAIYFVIHWAINYEQAKELEKQKLEVELQMLKGQINPHFLFNSINNIYGLSLGKSDKTPEALLKLSELLHAMLYECSQDKIPVEKEARMIHNYLELEKLRYGKKVDIFFKVSGDTKDFQMSPLLLVPLVENSFKHGVSESIDQCWVKIDLSVEADRLLFNIENSKVERVIEGGESPHQGIGLDNLKKRLALEYDGKSSLTVEDGETSFAVKLSLDNG